MRNTIRIKVNGTLPPHPSGTVVNVPVDEEGTPLALYWRRRLKDAKVDNCCEVVLEVVPDDPISKKARKRREAPDPEIGNAMNAKPSEE